MDYEDKVAFNKRLKNSIFMFDNESCEAHYDFIGSMHDELDHTELLVFKKFKGDYFCLDYVVLKRKHFDINRRYVYPKDIKVEVCDHTQDTGRAMVTVHRERGIAELVPSSKASDAVIKEQVQIAATIVNRNARTSFEDYEFTIKWERDRYVADTF